MKSNILFLFVLLFLSVGCSLQNNQNLKSPCADNNGPCKHIPVNNWWLPTEMHFNPAYAA